VPRDFDKAIAAYEQVAGRDDTTSMLELYMLLVLAPEPTRNPVKAAHWLGKAAESGSKDAMFDLGVAYFKGIGVKADAQQALSWLRRAREAGHTRAEREAELIERSLSGD
jgi:TPR repeat protein